MLIYVKASAVTASGSSRVGEPARVPQSLPASAAPSSSGGVAHDADKQDALLQKLRPIVAKQLADRQVRVDLSQATMDKIGQLQNALARADRLVADGDVDAATRLLQREARS